MKLLPYTDPTTGTVIQPTSADISANTSAVVQSQGVDKALAALKVSNPTEFETVRRLTFAEQAKHFNL